MRRQSLENLCLTGKAEGTQVQGDGHHLYWLFLLTSSLVDSPILWNSSGLYWLLPIRGGTGTGDYPVPAGYCTTRHYPDPAGYYFKIWPDPGNLSRLLQLSTIPHALQRNWALVMRPSRCTTLWRHSWPIIAHLALRRAGKVKNVPANLEFRAWTIVSSLCILNVNRSVFLIVIYPLVVSVHLPCIGQQSNRNGIRVFLTVKTLVPFLFNCCFWRH